MSWPTGADRTVVSKKTDAGIEMKQSEKRKHESKHSAKADRNASQAL